MIHLNSEVSLQFSDALYKTVVNPCCAERWHALFPHFAEASSAGHQIARDYLINNVALEGLAGFLLSSFLAEIHPSEEYSAIAGQLALSLQPVDPDRLMAFSIYEWGKIVAHGDDRQHFIRALKNSRIPQMIQVSGNACAEGLQVRFNPRKIETLKKVALVSTFLSHQSHTPTAMVFEQAHILKAMGLQLEVFSCQELRIEQMPGYLGSNGNFINYAPPGEDFKKLIPDGVKVHTSQENFSLKLRISHMLQSIAEFDPDLIFFVGLNSALVNALYPQRPVLGLCLHSVSPMISADIWLTANRALSGKLSDDWTPDLAPATGHYHPYRVKLKPTGAVISREQLGLNQHQPVLISVGARLESEISGEWAAKMLETMQATPNLVWLLVGGKGVLPPALAQIAPEQIRLIPHYSDARSLLRCADIYLNPPRMGGGFSVAEAMAESLAVLSFANSDGGIKLEEFAHQQISSYFAQLSEFIASPEARINFGKKMQQLFFERIDLEQSGPSLLKACALALEKFHQRQPSQPG